MNQYNRPTTEQFIAKARVVHGNKYDYSQVDYFNCNTKVCIICPTHGAFSQTPREHLRGFGCSKCRDEQTAKRQTKSKDYFLSQCVAVHGNRYDYSKVIYHHGRSKIEIICPVHGSFLQTPDSHLKGRGCPKCAIENSRDKVYGFGIVNISLPNTSKSKKLWRGMIERCYSDRTHKFIPAYCGCSVCEDWRTLSNFKEWFDDNYIDGYELDKYLLVKHNRMYSPETCCFISKSLNSLLTNRRLHRGQYPLGVRAKNNKYESRLGANTYLGIFPTVESAFLAYKKAKEKYVKELAEKYFREGKITERVYNALMKYEVEITD